MSQTFVQYARHCSRNTGHVRLVGLRLGFLQVKILQVSLLQVNLLQVMFLQVSLHTCKNIKKVLTILIAFIHK